MTLPRIRAALLRAVHGKDRDSDAFMLPGPLLEWARRAARHAYLVHGRSIVTSEPSDFLSRRIDDPEQRSLDYLASNVCELLHVLKGKNVIAAMSVAFHLGFSVPWCDDDRAAVLRSVYAKLREERRQREVAARSKPESRKLPTHDEVLAQFSVEFRRAAGSHSVALRETATRLDVDKRTIQRHLKGTVFAGRRGRPKK